MFRKLLRSLLILLSFLIKPEKADADDKIDVVALREVVEMLCSNDKSLMDEVFLALQKPEKYFAKFTEELNERGIEESEEVDYWLALIDGLQRRHCLVDVDWKNTGADLAWNLKQLRTSDIHKLDWTKLEKIAPNSTYTSELADEVEQVLKPAKLTAIFLVYSGDSYALSFVETSKLRTLQSAAHKLDQNIEIFDKNAGDK